MWGGLDRVAGGFGIVAAPGRGGPPEGAVGKLIDRPSGLLLEPVVMPAFRTRIAQTRTSARLIRRVVLEVALAGGSPADGAGAGGVPDLRQVPEPGAWVVAAGLVPVVAVVGGQGVQRDDQIGPVSRGAEPPGAVTAGRAVPAGRGEGEPGPARRRRARLVWRRLLGSGRAQPWPMAWPCWSVTVTHQVVVGFCAARGAGRGPATGRPGPARRARRAGPARPASGAQRDGQRDLPGEPARRGAPGGRAGAGAAPSGLRGGSLCRGAGRARRGRGAGLCRPPGPALLQLLGPAAVIR